jgi:hypothetical protein
MKVLAKELVYGSFALLAAILYTGSATHDRATKFTAPTAASDSALTMPVIRIPTLKPTFEWTASKDSGVVYDLVICEGLTESHGYWIPGKTVHHRDGLTKTRYTLDNPLAPDTIFVWSVRARFGNRTSKWAEYLDLDWSQLKTGAHSNNILWAFKTPAQ